jgi:exodeoxyribonuclease VII small subunit
MSTEASASFAEHYGRLRDINQRITELNEAQIDELLPLVEQGVESKKICEQRLAAVTAGLKELLGGAA